MSPSPPWYRIAADPTVLRRAVLTSIGVGTILTLVNRHDEVLGGAIPPTSLVPVAITFLVPFVVSLASSVIAVRVERRSSAAASELLESQIQAINRFPGQNPNPVMRVTSHGRLSYANEASGPITETLGVAVGRDVPVEWMARFEAAAAETPPGRVEVTNDRRTFDVLTVFLPDFDAYNLYGTDITAAKVVARFPDRNPNPVLRMSPNGILVYANDASAPITRGLGLSIGDPLPSELLDRLQAALADPNTPPVEVSGEGLIFRITPVPIPEFDFVNLYGTDITAARQVERLNAENERLLLNILPASIAERLRGGEMVIADDFDDMTVLFADVVGFTDLSARWPARDVVGLLNEIFSLCDRLTDRHGLEKIKTVGDAYMVVGGLAHDIGGNGGRPRTSHAADVADMALELLTEVASYRHEVTATGVQMRIGIHVGPAVAGVIGLKKFIYDVWGDTVNTASRMESTGVPGRIQVTPETYERLRGEFDFESRGPVDVKGKGIIETWLLLGRRQPAGGRAAGTAKAATD